MTHDRIIFFAMLFPSIILHEVSHGWIANVFGDDTAKRAGRLTLNPIAHVDPFGTIILPVLLIATTGRAFGYAKPVPVDPRNLRNPRDQSLLVSLAGPAVNIVLAVAAALLLPRAILFRQPGAWSRDDFLLNLGYANVLLAAFNLIPLPPLDGSAIVERLLPRAWWPGYLRVRQYSMGLLLILVLLLPGVLSRVFNSAFDLWAHLI
ncbi:MAG: site-2 protease family protein [Acidimicrobiia bacterium]|nr:site-2 protease family protein [Acidimicrobiia bacterium]